MEIAKECISCFEKINSKSKICKHCGSLQKSIFKGVNGVIVSSIASFIAIFISVLALVHPMFEKFESDVKAVFLDRADITVPILLVNKGNRPLFRF